MGIEQHKAESSNSELLEYGKFKNGDRVRVGRSDGTIEDDWVFDHKDSATNRLVVSKEVAEGTLTKRVSQDNFDKWQTEKDMLS